MSIINTKNKIYNLDVNSKIQAREISRIPVVDIQTVMNHNLKGGKLYTLIDDVCITSETDYTIFKTFQFNTLTEKLIPFIKFIPKVRTFDNREIGQYANVTFIPNWIQIEDYYMLLIGIYARSVDDEDNDIQLFMSLDILIKNIPYVQQLYLAKS